MNEHEARELADEINSYPIFRVDKIQEPIFGDGWSIRFTITYSNSHHWVNDREDFEWVTRNLSDPRGIRAVKEHEAARS